MVTAADTPLLNDRYQLGEVLGRGGMGVVHRAHDLRLGHAVAVKFLRRDLAVQTDARHRFEDEARNAARINHPNVVMVLDSGEHEGVPYLVMECLPGPSLHDEIARGPIAQARVKEIAMDVLSALAAAHELGVIHRDITPSNILLSDDGRAKIADFGIAKTAEGLDSTTLGQVLGTPAYLPPERLEGEPATPGTDLYALGVVLREALTGERTFKGDTPLAVAVAVRTADVVPLRAQRPDLDPALAGSIDAAMQPDPSRRVASAAEMLALVDGVGRVVPADAPAPTTVVIASAPAAATVVADRAAYATPAETVLARSWLDRIASVPRELWVGIGAVAAIGLLLLVLSTRPGDSDANIANQTTTSPPTTLAVTTPPTRAVSVAGTRTPEVKSGGKPEKGHGKKD